MALITVGSIDDLAVAPEEPSVVATEGAVAIDQLRVLAQASSEFPAPAYRFAESPEPRGMALSSLTLEKGAQVFIARLFKRTSKVYFLSWAWDYSGQAPAFYPGAVADGRAVLIPLKVGQEQRFLSSGAWLFPPRPVTGGMHVRVQIWKSRQGVRNFGDAMVSVANAVQASALKDLLSMAALAGGAPTMTAALAEAAATELTAVIGGILAGYGDGILDLFDGTYSATDSWSAGTEALAGHATRIVLNRLA